MNLLDLGSAVGYLLLDTSGFTKGFTSAFQAVKTLQNETATTSDKFAAVGTIMTATGSTLTKTVTLPLIGLGTAAVHTAAGFESAMSQVQATMGITKDSTTEMNGEIVNSMDVLENLAQEMGAKTAFSAVQAAEALNYMALAGYTVEESVQALPNVLNLAAAGGMDLALASDMVTDAQSALGLSMEESAQLTDKMATAASKSNTSVSQLGEAILTVGGTAKNLAGGTTELATILGILADNGIKGAEGGTALRNIILSLSAPTDKAAKLMDDLGLTAYDAEGNLRPLNDIFGDLNSILSTMTQGEQTNVLNDIFNKVDLKSVNALLANTGERFDELSGYIDDAAGSAETMADTQLDNLSGQLTILQSSIEGAVIAFGNKLLPDIKNLANGIQGLMNWINNLNDSQVQMIVTVLKVVAAVGPMLLIFGKLAGAISAITGLVSGAGGLSAVLTALTGPIGIVIAAVAALTAAWITDFGGIRETTTEILGTISKLIGLFLETIKNIWKTDLYGIRSAAKTIWKDIQQLFKAALDVILSVVKIFSAALKGDWKSVWEGVKSLAKSAWNLIKSAFKTFLDTLITLVVSIGVRLYTASQKVWNRFKEAATKAWNRFKSWFNEARQDPVNAILNLGSAMFNAGKNIISNLWEGLKSAWSGITDWFNDKISWIKNTVAKAESSVSSFSGTSGSYASGLDYVTHDQIVQVHRGEAILTQEENSQRRSGNNQGGDTYNFYSPKAMNPVTAAREMKKAKQQLALGVS